MKLAPGFILFSLLAFGCDSNKKASLPLSGLAKDTINIRKFSQINIAAEYTTPTVKIDSLKLITPDSAAQASDAKAILRAKVLLPLAMQKHDAALFDSALAREFTFRGENEFFERRAYIEDRVKGQWMISYVQYENLVLQFFGDIGVLTYRNIVTEKDEMGKPLKWYFTWADFWVKEDGRWKVGAIHLVESRKS